MTTDSETPPIVPVLVPMPAERPYSYAVPEGMAVRPGSIVRVPLGPREVAGIVWDGPGEAVNPKKLRPISELFDCPPIDEGIVETDRWFGPLFTNLRLIKTDVPIHFSTETPLLQVQPLQRSTYAEEVSNRFALVGDPSEFSAAAWARYEETLVKPNLDPARPVGAYATTVRRRRRGTCPVHTG
jgi:hypothetical protein